MRTQHFYATALIPELYRWFATEAAPTSPAWERVSLWVAETPEVSVRLDGLPGLKRQPNLFLAALRYLGGPTEPGPELASFVVRRWPEIEQVILTHGTQTNEVGRCAVLAPVLASLPQPLALVEVGMSAGACLALDRYGYTWRDEGGGVRGEQPAAEGVEVQLDCTVRGEGLPLAVPTIAWRAGIDLNPLDPGDPETVAWLRALVWPGEEARESRLAAALAATADVPIVRVTGDATTSLAGLIEQAPKDATLVVVHSAVLAYLDAPARAAHMAELARLGVHHVTNEGARVVPGVAEQLVGVREEPRPHFVLALDGTPLARVGPHGGWLEWLDRTPNPVG